MERLKPDIDPAQVYTTAQAAARFGIPSDVFRRWALGRVEGGRPYSGSKLLDALKTYGDLLRQPTGSVDKQIRAFEAEYHLIMGRGFSYHGAGRTPKTNLTDEDRLRQVRRRTILARIQIDERG